MNHDPWARAPRLKPAEPPGRYAKGAECPRCGYLLVQNHLCTHCNWAAPFAVEPLSRGEAAAAIALGAAAYRDGLPMEPPENVSILHHDWWCLGWKDAELEGRDQRGELPG